MAETKARSNRSAKTKSRSTSTKSRNGSSAQSKRSSSSTRKRSGQARSSRSGQQSSKQSTSRKPSKLAAFADKAKAPAAAGGAALVGLAGGLALSRRNSHKGVLARLPKPNVNMPKVKVPKISLPKTDSALKAVGSAAGEVADRSQRIGQVAAEVQKASDAIANSKRG